MSNRTSNPTHGSTSRHLSDTTGITIYSSSSSSSSSQTQTASKALTSLTNAYLSASELASRFDLGTLRRISVDTDRGISVRQSLLEAEGSSNGDNGPQGRGGLGIGVAGSRRRRGEAAAATDADDDDGQSPPSLVATVVAVAAASDPQDVRLAERELEGIGMAFQRAWSAEESVGERVDGGSESGSSEYEQGG